MAVIIIIIIGVGKQQMVDHHRVDGLECRDAFCVADVVLLQQQQQQQRTFCVSGVYTFSCIEFTYTITSTLSGRQSESTLC